MATLEQVLFTIALCVLVASLVINRWLRSPWRHEWLKLYRAPVSLLLFVLLVKLLSLIPALSSSLATRWVAQGIIAGLFIGLGWLFVRLATGVVFNIYFRRMRGIVIPKIIIWLTNKMLYVLAFLAYLNIRMGFSIGDLIITSAVILVVVGLSFQRPMGEFIANFITSIGLKFKVGDLLQVGDIRGEVEDIDWRWVCLRTDNGAQIAIPLTTLVSRPFTWYECREGAYLSTVKIQADSALRPNVIENALLDTICSIDLIRKLPEPTVRQHGSLNGCHQFEVDFSIEDIQHHAQVADQLYSQSWYKLSRVGVDFPCGMSTSTSHRMPSETELEIIYQQLLTQKLLSPLSHTELKTLAAQAKLGCFGRHECLFSQGDAGDSMFIIQSGSISVQIEANSGSPRLREVAVLMTGDFIGEMSLLTGEPRNATVLLREESELIEIDKQAISMLLSKNPMIAESFTQIISGRRAMTEKIRAEAQADDQAQVVDLLSKIKQFFQP